MASQFLSSQAFQILNTFVQNDQSITTELLQVLRLLLANQQGGTLAQMVVSPHQAQAGLHRSITGLVVHIVTVLLSRANNELLLPFLNMLTNSTILKVREEFKDAQKFTDTHVFEK